MTRRLLCGKGFRQDKACGCIQLLRITYHYQYAGECIETGVSVFSEGVFYYSNFLEEGVLG